MTNCKYCGEKMEKYIFPRGHEEKDIIRCINKNCLWFDVEKKTKEREDKYLRNPYVRRQKKDDKFKEE